MTIIAFVGCRQGRAEGREIVEACVVVVICHQESLGLEQNKSVAAA